MSMTAKIFVAASVFVAGVVPQNTDCSYGRFATNPITGTCMFDCEWDGRYVELNTLSFAFIREKCPSVNYAAIFYPSECSSVSDLVWPAPGRPCGCPSCKCSTENTEGDYNTHTQFVSKSCVECKCAADEWTYNSTQMVFDCDDISSVSNPTTWNDYTCPPVYCNDTESNAHESTEAFWNDLSGTCQYCYCTGSGETVCGTGYAEIATSSNAQLQYQFRYDCDYQTRACIGDGSRLLDYYASSSWSRCSYCPRCDCGSYEVGDSWYVRNQDIYDERSGSHSCAKCTCVSNNNVNYAECSNADGYSDFIGQCPPTPNTLQCHSQSSSAGNLTVDATLNANNCTESTQPYCFWTVDEDGSTAWDCGDPLFCDAYFSGGVCKYVDTTVTYTDCDGVEQTETISATQFCCTGTDNCNHVDIDTSSCVRATEYEDLIQSYYQCEMDNLDISCTTEDNVEITCSGIKSLYKAEVECMCAVYGAIYQRLSSSLNKQSLLESMDYLAESSTYWNDFFGCDIRWRCNLEKGGVLIDAAVNRFAVSAVVWTAAVVLMMR